MVKNSHAKAGDTRSILGLGRSSKGGHGNPLQYSCQENLMDRGAWKATGHGVTKTKVTECTQTHTHNVFLDSTYIR